MSMSQKQWQEKEAPRYTSYPPAIHFLPLSSQETHVAFLQAIQPGTRISLYVHVPYCKSLCWFCGCHTKITQNENKLSDYATLLLQEMALIKQYLNSNAELDSVHFGGGSPNLLSTKDIERVMDGIRALCSSTDLQEVAIELDPRTTSATQVKDLAMLGFNRVSLGIQDFDPEVQKAIHRIQPFSMVSSLVDELRRANLTHINCDIIYGLPLQTYARFEETLRQLMMLDPSRIALFSYAHLPHLKKHQQMIPSEALPSFQEKIALFHLASQLFIEQGYQPIGIDHFAKTRDALSIAFNEHRLSRNFQGYVANPSEVLIGIGSSSISQFPEGYIQNHANLAEYQKNIQKNTLASFRGWQFTREDCIRKTVIDALMCYLSVDLNKICQTFHLDPTYFEAEIAQLMQQPYLSMVKIKNNCLQMVTDDRMMVRLIAAVFDPRHKANSGRCSVVN